jgi:hypothetical protein
METIDLFGRSQEYKLFSQNCCAKQRGKHKGVDADMNSADRLGHQTQSFISKGGTRRATDRHVLNLRAFLLRDRNQFSGISSEKSGTSPSNVQNKTSRKKIRRG